MSKSLEGDDIFVALTDVNHGVDRQFVPKEGVLLAKEDEDVECRLT